MNYKMEDSTYEVLYPQTQVENISDFLSYMQENYYSKSESDSNLSNIIKETTAVSWVGGSSTTNGQVSVSGCSGLEKLIVVLGPDVNNGLTVLLGSPKFSVGLLIESGGQYPTRRCVVSPGNSFKFYQFPNGIIGIAGQARALLFY